MIDLGVQDGREQEFVVALPDRPRIAVAVADVDGAGRALDALIHHVDGAHRQPDLLWITGQERLVDLQHGGACLRQRSGFAVQHARKGEHQVVGVGVGLVLDAACE